jgi:hypothetical protein
MAMGDSDSISAYLPLLDRSSSYSPPIAKIARREAVALTDPEFSANHMKKAPDNPTPLSQ